MSNKSIIIPVNNKPTKIESVQNFVIVGANGSGKSHLGAWIEQQSANGEVLRISAQRALSIPDSITIKSEEAAWNKIYYGEELHHDKNYKWNWGNGLTTKLIDDYDSVTMPDNRGSRRETFFIMLNVLGNNVMNTKISEWKKKNE